MKTINKSIAKVVILPAFVALLAAGTFSEYSAYKVDPQVKKAIIMLNNSGR